MAADRVDHAGSTNDSTKNAAKQTAQDVKQGAQRARERVMDEAKGVTGRTRERVKSTVNQQKDRAADEIGSFAEAFRKTGDELRQQDHGQVAKYAEQVAEQVEHFSSYLHDKDASEFVHSLEDFARRRPALFIGGAVALGVMAARFLKSSSSGTSSRDQSRYMSSQERGYGA